MLKDKIIRAIKRLFITNDTHISSKGTIDSTVLVINSLISGEIHIKRNSKIEKSTLFHKINIDSNVTIKNSKIESNIFIGEGTKIVDSELASGTAEIKIGSHAIIENAKIHGKLITGENIKIIDGVFLSGKITLGRNVSLNGPGMDIISNLNEVKIGNFCSIARNVAIQEYNHNFNNLSSYFMHQNMFNETKLNDIVSKGSIEIKNDVWIGTQSIILSGVTIGNGAVVAANSTIVDDVPDYAIVGGSPARVISYRFSKEIIEELLKMKWWDWTDEKIHKNRSLFLGEITLDKLKNAIQ
jgi:virginiamycin A acetyltransferase